MSLLRNTEKVWSYVEAEFREVLGRSPSTEEATTIVLVVSAVTKLLADWRVIVPSQRPEPDQEIKA